ELQEKRHDETSNNLESFLRRPDQRQHTCASSLELGVDYLHIAFKRQSNQLIHFINPRVITTLQECIEHNTTVQVEDTSTACEALLGDPQGRVYAVERCTSIEVEYRN